MMARKVTEGLDTCVQDILRAFNISGLAVAIVDKSGLLFAKGFGVVDRETQRPVDESTIFGIGSNTKTFTAAAVQMLAAQGKISLDDRVEDHLPAFRMSDPYVSREVTIRDLLCHRTGLGTHTGDLLFIPPSDLSRAEIVERVRGLPIAHSLRSRFAYSNVGYVIAGELLANVSGIPWDNFVETNLLRPLRMESTLASTAQFQACRNRAEPYIKLPVSDEIYSEEVRISPVNVDNQGAAGAICTSATDIVCWLKFLIGSGDASTQLLPRHFVQEMMTPQVLVPVGALPPSIAMTAPTFSAYGLGLRLVCYRGHTVAFHGGNIYGYTSLVTAIPEVGIAFAVLCNSDDAREAIQALHYWLLERSLDCPNEQWIPAFLAAKAWRLAEAERRSAAKDNLTAVAPPVSLEGCAGDYIDRWFGRATVRRRDNRLVLSMCGRQGMEAVLERLGENSFCARWDDRLIADAKVRFSRNWSGSVDGMQLSALSPLADPSFDYQTLAFQRVPTAANGTSESAC